MIPESYTPLTTNEEGKSLKEGSDVIFQDENVPGKILVIAEREFYDLYQSLFPEGSYLQLCTPYEAIDQVKGRQFDLVLIDSGLDSGGALNLLREVKSLAPNTPVIFVGEKGTFDSVRQAYRAGARDYIDKPVNIIEMKGNMERLLQLRKTSKEKRSPFIVVQEAQSADSIRNLTSDKPAYIIRAIRYIEENLSTKISLGGIAHEANFSKYHFCRIFARYTGMTPFQFTSVMRIEKAKELLIRDDLTVSQIAAQVGFNDLGTFLRQFKKITGITPTKYKHQMRDRKASESRRNIAARAM